MKQENFLSNKRVRDIGCLQWSEQICNGCGHQYTFEILYLCIVYYNELVNEHHKLFIYIYISWQITVYEIHLASEVFP